jgi:hypothetical protein
MADLAITEADLQSLSAALVMALTDLEALQHSFRHMDAGPVGAPPLLEEEQTLTSTRANDLTVLGEGIAARHDDVERVVPTLRATDHRLASDVQRAK